MLRGQAHKQHLANIEGDVATRNATDVAEFSMTVGNRVFAGKGAREEAATALTLAILTWRDDQSLQTRAVFRGFEILSRAKTGGFGLLQGDERIPDLFIRGRATYSANLNPVNPVGTVQSIEHTLRNLDKLKDDQKSRVARIEKELADYQAQAERPFEHEERLKHLLARQAELNAALDLDKGDQQGADSAPELKEDLDVSRSPAPAEPSHDLVAKMAEAYMRASKTAIQEMPISQRTPPQTGPVTGRAVAKDDVHVAVATAANSFFVVPSTSLGREVEIGERLSLRFQRGLPSLEDDRARAR
jgi:hypothetical protein